MQSAAILFPYSHTIRTRPAYFVIKYAAPSPGSVVVLAEALRGDPYAPDLIKAYADHNYFIGDHRAANAAFDVFARLAPNSPLGQQVKDALAKLQEHSP